MQLPPLNAIRAFESVARHVSFTLAAQELHVTPAAVSHQVKLLETFLGLPLFIRKTRQIELTREATLYLPAVRGGLSQIADATRQLLHQQSRVVTISAAPAFASGWLMQRLYDFYRQYPEINIQINTSATLVDFSASDADMAVRFGRGGWEGLECHLLHREELIMACSPELLSDWGGALDDEQLVRIPLLHSLAKPLDWPDWYARNEIARDDPTEGLKFEYSSLVVQAAGEGLGFALVDRLMAQPELDRGQIVQATIGGHFSGKAFYLISPKGRQMRESARIFSEWLKAQSPGGEKRS